MSGSTYKKGDRISAGDAAEILGVAQQNLRSVSGLPKPVQEKKGRTSTLWDALEIEAFAALRRAERDAAALRERELEEAEELHANVANGGTPFGRATPIVVERGGGLLG
jgi:hypothetical protein